MWMELGKVLICGQYSVSTFTAFLFVCFLFFLQSIIIEICCKMTPQDGAMMQLWTLTSMQRGYFYP